METSKCQVCGSPVEKGANAKLCRICETPHHPECWEYNGGCTTYACKESPAIKNQAPRRPAVIVERPHVSARQRDPRGDGWPHRGAPHHQQPVGNPSAFSAFVDTVIRAVGMTFTLFMGFAFCAGFIGECINGRSSRRNRGGFDGGRGSKHYNASRNPTRADLVKFGDQGQVIQACRGIATDKDVTRDEVRAVGAAATWNSDPKIRLAATEALIAVKSQGNFPQEYLAVLLGTNDIAQRKLVRQGLAASTSLSEGSTRELVSQLDNSAEVADEAMDLLEKFSPPPAQLINAMKGRHPPRIYQARLDALASKQ